jgi:hypothetical protein
MASVYRSDHSNLSIRSVEFPLDGGASLELEELEECLEE